MDKKTLMYVGMGIGAAGGSLLSMTKVGQKINEKLEEAFNKFKDDVVPILKEISNNSKKENSSLMEV